MMSQILTSKEEMTWGDLVEAELGEPPEGIIFYPYQGPSEREDLAHWFDFRSKDDNQEHEEKDVDLTIDANPPTPSLENEQTDQEKSDAAAVSSVDPQLQDLQVENSNSPASATPCSGDVKNKKSQSIATPTCNDVKTEQDPSESFGFREVLRSGYVKRQWVPFKASEDHETNQVDLKMQESAHRHRQMTPVNQQLEAMRDVLYQKNLALTREKEKRIAAEDDCMWSWKKLNEVELSLEEEKRLRLDRENKIIQAKCDIQKLRQSASKKEAWAKLEEAKTLALENELENLKTQIQANISANLELATKLKVEKDASENLEWEIATLRLKVRSNLVSPDAPESSATQKLVSSLTVSTQTEDCTPEVIHEPTEDSDLKRNEACSDQFKNTFFIPEVELGTLRIKFPEPAEGVRTRDAVAPENLLPKTEALEQETVSQPVEMNKSEWISKPEEVSEPVKIKNTGFVCELSNQFVFQKQEVSSQPFLFSAKSEVFQQTTKKVRCRIKSKSKQCQLIEEMPTPQKDVPNLDLVIPSKRVVKIKISKAEEVTAPEVKSQSEYNPSWWRRFKKFLTPSCMRQYKHKRQNQNLDNNT